MSAPSSDSELLQDLVVEALGRLEDGDMGIVEELCARHPDLADRLRERMRALDSIGLLDVDAGADAFPERLGEFRLVRRLGGGGMGVVYRAVQESLGRDVALKVIRRDFLYFPQARERFRREVETVACLQHPGIVPIHTVGEEDGVPYFAMELVRGCTLGEVLRHLEGRDSATLEGADLAAAVVACTPDASPDDALASAGSLFQGTWPETCFRVVQGVADALQHVHEHGVLHRDLKPSNIMITPTGRVMLVDFGLASASAGADALTRTGSQLGSVPYMPPEQISGDTSALDARADVYSLGVTLYELLTLRSPYHDRSFETMRRKIIAGEASPIRQQNRAVSWEMETVCLTAFDRDPERRYATIRELARDLGNALQARPLLARRPGPWLRTRRYLQRHPTLSAVALVAFLLLTLAASGFGLFERNARARVHEQREHALANLADARAAVDRMLKRVSEGVLTETPYMEEVRRLLLEDALALHRQLLDRHGDVPELRFEAGETWQSTGRIHDLLGRAAEARAAYEQALEEFDDLRSRFPDELDYHVHYASALRELATLLAFKLNDFEAARELLGQALAVHRDVLAHRGGDPFLTVELAATHARLSKLDHRTSLLPEAEAEAREAVRLLDGIESDRPEVLEGRIDANTTLAAALASRTRYGEARTCYERAIELQQRWIDDAGQSVDRRARLAGLQLELTRVLRASEVRAGTEESCQATLDALRALVAEYPRVPAFRTRLAETLRLQERIYADVGNHAGAERALMEVIDVFGELHAEFPDQGDYLQSLAQSHRSLAAFYETRGRHADSAQPIATALGLYDELIGRHPDDPAYKMEKSVTHNALGTLHWTAGRYDEAEEAFLASLAIMQELAAQYPDTPSFASLAASTATNVGIVLQDSDPGRAERFFRQAITTARDLTQRYPEEGDHDSALAFACTSLGILLENHERVDEAVEQYRKALALRSKLTSMAPDQPDLLSDLGGAKHNLASALERLGAMDEAIDNLEQALEHQRAALEINPRHPWYRRFLRNHLSLLTKIRLGLGRYEAAAETTRRYEESIPEDVETHTGAAELWARCAALATEDADAQAAEACATRAEAALERAATMGFRDASWLEKDQPWQVLRGRARYERLKAGIEEAAPVESSGK